MIVSQPSAVVVENHSGSLEGATQRVKAVTGVHSSDDYRKVVKDELCAIRHSQVCWIEGSFTVSF